MNILDDFKLQYKTGDITQKLIFWNVGIAIPFFILSAFAPSVFQHVIDWLSLSSTVSKVVVKPWTFITYAFLHADFWHLLFNMIVLNFSSRLFLTYFTQKQFFGLYLLGAVFAGLVFVLSDLFLHSNTILVGASGAIMAVLIAAATYSPLSEIRLLLIGNVKLWHIALVLFVLDLIQIPMSNTGGHLAHIGGSLFGFLYIKLLQNGTDLSKIVSNVIDYFVSLFSPRKATPFKKVHRNANQQTQTKPTKPQKDMTQQQIDEILDKISKSGYDSLTKEEKEFLFKVGK
ncbi:putative membrane protein [Flavobacterium saliperosum S13]|uniref:Membrane associated serine protease, rhomboid family n=2 Tax=Flavobacterium saliperosum TaxID=329186 RepID=A0A1G4VQS7_9FLAO|nr:rhomboid family intramembrane serine protease [Flavobacterium saliperosum]ESU23828.1 putative membrane protein [Flavobacterium saliperosum S13]SCX10440.1 Membrane associated serine protease, rhomboid family [Flavobacterium saliperosum]